MQFLDFKQKLEHCLRCNLNEEGYILGTNGKTSPIRDLAYFANKEKKYAKRIRRREGKGPQKLEHCLRCNLNEEGYILGRNGKKLPIRDLAYFANKEKKYAKRIRRREGKGPENLNANDIIMLKYLQRIHGDSYSIYKIFKSIGVKDKQKLFHTINVYADRFFGQNEDYSEDLDRLEIDIIKNIQGGCSKRELKTNDAMKRIIHPKSSNNNCFYKCIQSFVLALKDKVVKSEFNKIRKLLGLESDSLIDVTSALAIFQKFSDDGKNGLEIWTNDIIVGELKGSSDGDTLIPSFQDEHYSVVEIKKYQYCNDCGRKYIKKHTCNTNMQVYKLINEDAFNFDHSNESIVIVHYDIETHTRYGSDGMNVHIPYILGFIDSITSRFQYFTGSDCMDHLSHICLDTASILNQDDSIQLDQLVLNNGAILKASTGNISCFDISKHTMGTLRHNLKELGCSVQKGEFDYSLGDEWEKMTKDNQDDCIKYLEGDVLGLKELSERLNSSCFKNFKPNLYKFLSTSQLTYAAWINFLYSDSGNPVFLQTPEQEKFFRESIYGGNLSFNDIDDYLIYADVNSLYPAAMKNEYPFGVPVHLKPVTPSVEFFNRLIETDGKCPKFGIYRIEYVTNKNLIDGILPRRLDGRLIWDLQDSIGVYNSIDIDNALEQGYKVKILEGYYWEKTANVFKDYINYLYDFKKNAKKGSAQYKLAKLMMNGLYGKTIQRPILDESVIIRLHEEFIKYHVKYGGVSMRALSDGSFYLTYQDEEKSASKITKPC
ncbi:hypothetical protein MP638_001050 [Amoeboaphelidium occidentale]|nr:hypothetical protein MP638_001050 [Amoeboaphelidium occidentale]